MVYYYDRLRHLVCIPYSLDHLHNMASVLGIKRCWFHNKPDREHYDVPKKMMADISKLAIEISPYELLNIIKNNKATN